MAETMAVLPPSAPENEQSNQAVNMKVVLAQTDMKIQELRNRITNLSARVNVHTTVYNYAKAIMKTILHGNGTSDKLNQDRWDTEIVRLQAIITVVLGQQIKFLQEEHAKATDLYDTEKKKATLKDVNRLQELEATVTQLEGDITVKWTVLAGHRDLVKRCKLMRAMDAGSDKLEIEGVQYWSHIMHMSSKAREKARDDIKKGGQEITQYQYLRQRMADEMAAVAV